MAVKFISPELKSELHLVSKFEVEHYLDVCDGVNMKNYYSVTYLDKLNRKHTISFDYIHDLFEFIFHHTTNNKNNV